MEAIVSHLDITPMFCQVDDFCQRFEQLMQPQLQLPAARGEKQSQSRLHRCEIMTIMIAFHGSGFRTFKEFYTLQVLPPGAKPFPTWSATPALWN